MELMRLTSESQKTTAYLYIDTIPDYEDKPFYQVRVQASDGDNIADLDVTITVIDVDEPGVVTLSPTSPGGGDAG